MSFEINYLMFPAKYLETKILTKKSNLVQRKGIFPLCERFQEFGIEKEPKSSSKVESFTNPDVPAEVSFL